MYRPVSVLCVESRCDEQPVCWGPCWAGGRVRHAYTALGPLIAPSAVIFSGSFCVSLESQCLP